jgi:hypothetical protein
VSHPADLLPAPIPGWHASEVWVVFAIVDPEWIGRPEERQYTQELSVHLTIDGPVLERLRRRFTDASDRAKVYYWAARQALENGTLERKIRWQDESQLDFDITRIEYPVSKPFDIEIDERVEMGFHAR